MAFQTNTTSGGKTMASEQPNTAVTCPECGNIYDEEVANGCPVCGYGSVDDGQVKRDGSYGGHKEVVRRIVEADGPMSMGDLFRQYQDEVDDPRSIRTVRDYLTELHLEGELEARGEKRGRRYAPA